jgi:hypothetical protein
MRLLMIIQPANYDTTAELLTALDQYITGQGEVYINKLDYDLNRSCEQVDYFINILNRQVQSDFADYVPTPGFEDYTPPLATYNIEYFNGNLTTYTNTTTTYSPTDTVTFSVVGSDSNVDIVYYEVQVSIVTAYNVAITQTATVTATENDADYSIDIPADWIGDATVTSIIANTRQEPIYYGLSESPYSFGTITQDNSVGFMGVLDAVLLGDLNTDGLISQPDLLTATSRTYAYRLAAHKHFSITPFNTTYDPISSVKSFLFRINPVTADYSFQLSSLSDTYTGQKKDLSDLSITGVIYEDAAPLAQFTINPSAASLNADGSLDKTLNLTAVGGDVYIIFQANSAVNDSILPASYDQATNNQVTVFFDGIGDIDGTVSPGDSESFKVYAVANVGAQATPIAYTLASNPLLQSRYKLQGYATSDFTGDVIVEQEFSVEEPTSPGPTINLMHDQTVTVPSTHDRDIYWKPVWSFLRYSNLVFLEQLSDSNVDLANIGNLSLSTYYYDPSDADDSMTVSFTPDAGIDGANYRITLIAVDTLSITNNYTIASNVPMNEGPWSWTRNDMSQNSGLDRIKVTFSIVGA